ncbi:MAG TPA: maleylpyruvate isomerase family mycothiol-dependent enzyme [Streptosporangiaceae bacterium]
MTGPAADPPEPGPAGRPPGPGPGTGGLLAAALEYALRAAEPAGPGLLARPTPCRGWDLRMLLRHVAESLAVLQEGLTSRRIALHPGPEDAAVTADPLAAFRDRAARLLAASRAHDGGPGHGAGHGADGPEPHGHPVTGPVNGLCRAAALTHGVILIGGHWLPRDIAAGAGALEVAMHGWDIALACGRPEPIPGPLAARLLQLSPLLVPAAGRAPLFAEPVPVPAAAGPSDQLAAFLGRSPGQRLP